MSNMYSVYLHVDICICMYVCIYTHVSVYERARKERQETDRWIDETRKGEGGREHSDVARRFISIILYFSQT